MKLASILVVVLSVVFGCDRHPSSTSEQAVIPTEHEVVSTVRSFLKAVDEGDYERAISLGTPDKFRREWLAKMNEHMELSKAELVQVRVGKKYAAVLTNPIPDKVADRQVGQSGFSLRKHGSQWLIMDSDFLPHKDAVEAWLSDFESNEPMARSVPVGK